MKRVLCILLAIIILFCFKIDHFSHSKLSDSLAEKEIAVTFINKSLLLINIKDNEFLINLTDDISSSMIKKYQLSNIPIYTVSNMPTIDGLDIYYKDNTEFSLVYENRKFCIGKFYDCDFTYLYENDSYIDADIYFYNTDTVDLIKNIDVKSYSVNPIISILWDEKNYMIVTY